MNKNVIIADTKQITPCCLGRFITVKPRIVPKMPTKGKIENICKKNS